MAKRIFHFREDNYARIYITPGNLFSSNRSLVAKMIHKTKKTRLGNNKRFSMLLHKGRINR